ncbi:MAG: hypothetical protein ACJART_001446 [Maribacter sp.]|jgi:hypothetical protein
MSFSKNDQRMEETRNTYLIEGCYLVQVVDSYSSIELARDKNS